MIRRILDPHWVTLKDLSQLSEYNKIMIESNGYFIGNTAGSTTVSNTQDMGVARYEPKEWFIVGNTANDATLGEADKIIQCSIKSDPGNANADSYMIYSKGMSFTNKITINMRILQFGDKFSIGNNAKNQYIDVSAMNAIATSKVPGTAGSDSGKYCTIYYWNNKFN